ncbi:MAG TPA: hypothetical protein VI749_08165 [Candidatus Omnitrophota bacterium]|nr:hypothetical protein [Candidatus Omnitrophota bacterium]
MVSIAAALFLCPLINPSVFAEEGQAYTPYVIPVGEIQKEKDEITDNDLLNAVRAGSPQVVNTKAKIISLLIQVNNREIDPEDFYKEVSKLQMEPGKEVRHTLMEVKKDVGNYLGRSGLEKIFGTIYDSGGSWVEARILTHRKKVVMDTIQKAIEIYAKTNPKVTFYYGEVGGWPKEAFDELKFAGDIDFNFLAGDLDAAMELKRIFDDLIKERFNGRTPEDLDIPCTIHGMATGEVYVGKHGQAFAEAVTKFLRKISFGDDGNPLGILDEKIPFEQARQKMVLEAQAKEVNSKLADLQASKWPNQPGISLEMIRHFEHDIVGQNVYTDLESFVKAAKYADRSFTFLKDDLGEDAIKDKVLRKLTADLTEHKANPKKQVELIEAYFIAIGKPLPFDVNFAITADGKEQATIKANEKIIREFWDVCRKTMWESANVKIKKITEDMNKRIAVLGENDGEEAKKIYEELRQYHEMLEVEDLILNDEKAGVHGHLDPEYKMTLSNFRETVKTFKQKIAKNNLLKYIDPKLDQSFKWIEEMLKMGQELNVKMAWAAVMDGVGKVNDILDFFDDTLMNKLRQGEGESYIQILRKGQGQYWKERANEYLKYTPWKGRFDGQFDNMEATYNAKFNDISSWMNKHLEGKLASRGLKLVQGAGGAVVSGIRTINTTFNESVASSTFGSGLMKGMMVYNLKDELPLYYNLIGERDFEGLAAEFFKRRIPFGGAVERGVMGDYYGVAWELTSTLIPPVALFSAAASVGEYVAMTSFEAYFDEELETFIDNLYEGAEFKIAGVKQVGEDIKVSSWQLLSVSYNAKKYDYNELIQMEISDAREMGACLQQPSDQRSGCFPMEKMGNGLFEWWRNSDAFEHAFKKSDPWLQMIMEMEKDPLAGAKLKDHFRYQKYTRLEQIKVDFLKRTKVKLEERRAGEQALLSGKFLEMYDELLKITEELDIRVQLEETIDEKFGGEIVQFLTWMKDYLRGTIRYMKGDVDVWDIYEELSAFVAKDLGVYNKVLEGRAEAEKELVHNPVDQGLRILTGPYFLKGESSGDESLSKKWIELPTSVKDTMTEKLSAIKSELKADPVELDLNEGSYDRGALERLVYHDFFRAMWKQVNSSFTDIKIPSYLGKSPAKQTIPNAEGEMSDQSRAMERFAYHSQWVEDILEEFRKHYESQEDEEGEGEGEVEGNLADILAKLEALQAKAESLENQADEMSDTITGNAKALEKELKSLQDTLQKLSSEVTGLNATLAAQSANVSTINSEERFVYGLGEKLGRLRSSIEDATLSTCEIYDMVKATDRVDELDKLIGEAKTHYSSVNAQFGDYLGVKGQFDSARSRVEAERAKAGAADATLSGYESQFTGAQARLEAARAQLAGIESMTAAVQGYVGEADGVVQEAVELVNAATPTEGDEVSKDDKKVFKQLDRLLERIKKSQAGVIKSHGRVATKKDALLSSISPAESALSQVRATLDGLKQTYASDQFKQQLAAALNEFQATYDAADLFIEPIEVANKNAKICMDGIQSQYDRKTTPEARVAQADCSPWPGTFAEWDYANNRVQCNCPSDQVWVEARNSCYDKIAAAIESIDCSVYPNSEPKWSEADQKALCYCFRDYEWNNGRNACRVRSDIQVSQADCSMYGPSEAYWDNGVETVRCRCLYGYEWNSNTTYCVEGIDAQVARTDCSRFGPGAYAYWDNGRGQPACDCGNGYQWNAGYTYCEQLPVYGADDFVRDVGEMINVINQVPPNVDVNNQNSGCTPGRTDVEKTINAALGCPGGGGGLGNTCCRDGSPVEFGAICLDGSQPVYPCSFGGGDNTGGRGWTNTGYGGGGGEGPVTNQMTGNCQGTISSSLSAGRPQTPHTITVNISPAHASNIAKVTSDNPGCRSCDLNPAGYGTWNRTFYFTGTSGTFTLTYIAYDHQGNNVCSGSIVLRVLP